MNGGGGGGGGGAYCLEGRWPKVYVVWNKAPGILRGLGRMLPWIFFVLLMFLEHIILTL